MDVIPKISFTMSATVLNTFCDRNDLFPITKTHLDNYHSILKVFCVRKETVQRKAYKEGAKTSTVQIK